MSTAPMIVNIKATRDRYAFKCGCCVATKSRGGNTGRARDAERRMIKRRERQADRLEVAV